MKTEEIIELFRQFESIANELKNTADFLKEQGRIKKSPTLKEYKDHVQTKYLKEALEK